MDSSVWPPRCPETLFNICIEYCVQNLELVICDVTANHDMYQLKEDIAFPSAVSEELMKALVFYGIKRKHLGIISDPNVASWKRINVSAIRDLTDDDLHMLMAHKPMELRISSVNLTQKSCDVISSSGQNLVVLSIEKSKYVLYQHEDVVESFRHQKGKHDRFPDARNVGTGGPLNTNKSSVLNCPQLQALTIRDASDVMSHMISDTICTMPLLTKLDLSFSDVSLIELAPGLHKLCHLQALHLVNVPLQTNTTKLEDCLEVIVQIKWLRVLVLAQTDDHVYYYPGNVVKSMMHLINQLPLLTYLDVSGTNLGAWLLDEGSSHRPESVVTRSIPNSISKDRFKFLGLFNSADDVCSRDDLPAEQVTGTATEEQILLSIETYLDVSEFLFHSLNELFTLFRDNVCTDHRRALLGILAAMQAHRENCSVQIAGSASLFYVVKGKCKDVLSTKLKRTVLTVLLDAMENHITDQTVMRNGCLTLCQFLLPRDAMFCYKRIVKLLLKSVAMKNDELKLMASLGAAYDNFVQYICIFLLNALACQVEFDEKVLLGQIGVIDVMLSVITEMLRMEKCDEVMIYAWSLMWNVTDETDVNCQTFIDGNGLGIFMKCLRAFPDTAELLRNMMGLLGNVAEVSYLRPRLMVPEYLTEFSKLLKSTSDGIEVSYNSCGVLANLMSDGFEAWKDIKNPSRSQVSSAMTAAISSWNLDRKRNINYRSFGPILRLVLLRNMPEVQYWAVWALCNLTKVSKEKYCSLLEKEGGLSLLQELCSVTQSDCLFARVSQLAQQTLARCRKVSENLDYRSDDEAEDSVVNEQPMPDDFDVDTDDNDDFVDDSDVDNY